MGKIMLLNVGPKAGEDTGLKHRKPVADITGLSGYLGYRPLFCTQVFPDNMKETWFRFVVSSCQYIRVLSVFEIDESDAVPMDYARWCMEHLSRYGRDKYRTPADFQRCLVKAGSDGITDWLVKEIPSDARQVPMNEILSSGNIGSLVDWMPKTLYGYFFTAYYANILSELEQQFCMEREKCERVLGRKISDAEFVDKCDIATLEGRYAAMCNTSALLRGLCLSESPTYWDMYDLLEKSDMFDDPHYSLTDQDIVTMRKMFYYSVDIVFEKYKDRINGMTGVKPYDPCFCGSGKKYKKCHGRMGIQEYFESLICANDDQGGE